MKIKKINKKKGIEEIKKKGKKSYKMIVDTPSRFFWVMIAIAVVLVVWFFAQPSTEPYAPRKVLAPSSSRTSPQSSSSQSCPPGTIFNRSTNACVASSARRRLVGAASVAAPPPVSAGVVVEGGLQPPPPAPTPQPELLMSTTPLPPVATITSTPSIDTTSSQVTPSSVAPPVSAQWMLPPSTEVTPAPLNAATGPSVVSKGCWYGGPYITRTCGPNDLTTEQTSTLDVARSDPDCEPTRKQLISCSPIEINPTPTSIITSSPSSAVVVAQMECSFPLTLQTVKYKNIDTLAPQECVCRTGAAYNKTLYGEDYYAGDICTAAVHSGMLKSGQSSNVKYYLRPDVTYFKGSVKNGVTSLTSVTYPGKEVAESSPFVFDNKLNTPPEAPLLSASGYYSSGILYQHGSNYGHLNIEDVYYAHPATSTDASKSPAVLIRGAKQEHMSKIAAELQIPLSNMKLNENFLEISPRHIYEGDGSLEMAEKILFKVATILNRRISRPDGTDMGCIYNRYPDKTRRGNCVYIQGVWDSLGNNGMYNEYFPLLYSNKQECPPDKVVSVRCKTTKPV